MGSMALLHTSNGFLIVFFSVLFCILIAVNCNCNCNKMKTYKWVPSN